jgi:hypothetical protein
MIADCGGRSLPEARGPLLLPSSMVDSRLITEPRYPLPSACSKSASSLLRAS